MTDDDKSFVASLFAREVPEIDSGRVEIRSIARKPGYRTKLALYSSDVDPIAACLGVRNSRIKTIVDALDGERIELLRWADSAEEMIANALQPAILERIILHPAQHRAVVFVRSDHLPIALGPAGANRDLVPLQG